MYFCCIFLSLGEPFRVMAYAILRIPVAHGRRACLLHLWYSTGRSYAFQQRMESIWRQHDKLSEAEQLELLFDRNNGTHQVDQTAMAFLDATSGLDRQQQQDAMDVETFAIDDHASTPHDTPEHSTRHKTVTDTSNNASDSTRAGRVVRVDLPESFTTCSTLLPGGCAANSNRASAVAANTSPTSMSC